MIIIISPEDKLQTGRAIKSVGVGDGIIGACFSRLVCENLLGGGSKVGGHLFVDPRRPQVCMQYIPEALTIYEQLCTQNEVLYNIVYGILQNTFQFLFYKPIIFVLLIFQYIRSNF